MKPPLVRRRSSKGERTRRTLIDVARVLMERDGYLSLRVTDVAQTAGVSIGVFYIYFKDKEAISLCVFQEACEQAISATYSGILPSDPFDAVRETISRFVSVILDSGQIMRAVAQMLDQMPEARAVWSKFNGNVSQRIAHGMQRRMPGAVAGPTARVVYAHAAQAMLDTLLLGLISDRQPDLAQLAQDRGRMVEAFAIMWFRLVYGRDPDRRKCAHAQDFLAVGDELPG